jgi:ABC-2 type transport system permease protein
MIFAVAKNRLFNLRRDRAAFVLAFVLPIAFFSIFAAIFAGSTGRDATRRVRVAVADEDGSENSKRFVAALKAEAGLDVRTSPEAESAPPTAPYDAAAAERAVRHGDVPVALVIPKGFGEQPLAFGDRQGRPTLSILADTSDPIAPQVLGGLVQKVAMTSMPDVMARQGLEEVDRWSGGLTPEQRQKVEQSLEYLKQEVETHPSTAASQPPAGAAADRSGLVAVEVRDIVGETKKNPTVTFYAAGLGVMFLLFSATGAGGALIEEAESGTLDRILATRVTMGKLLLGKLVYLTGVGIMQLVLMFVWGALFFGLELTNHIPGFLVMTVVTALACSAFGLMLASVSRSRMQLVAISNLSILVMSALGGSLFPRFLMPEKIQKLGLVTLNAWALDGFQKIFWRNEPLWTIWPQVAVLLALTAAFFLAARRVARRWEAA